MKETIKHPASMINDCFVLVGKLAPLWPAIGIVLIMVILVAIIAISEKRRKAQEADKDK